MNILLAPDGYKGSLSATDVAATMAEAIKSADPTIEIQQVPLSDGGEGFLKCFENVKGYQKYFLSIHNAKGDIIDAPYLVLPDHTVIIEYAEIAGLTQLSSNELNPDLTTSYGLGELLNHLLQEKYRKIVIGIGGSATNDAGYGMLCALGLKAYDKSEHLLNHMGESVLKIAKIKPNDAFDKLKDIELIIASDVSNPLVGKHGASYIFGPQKGASPDQVEAYHQAHVKLSQLLIRAGCEDFAEKEGAGAAGGLGFALLHLGGRSVSGAAYCAEVLKLEAKIHKADLVITGEGKSDFQTLEGKAPFYLAQLGQKYNKPVILISGMVEDMTQLNTVFAGSFAIINRPLPIEESMRKAKSLLYNQTLNLLHFLLHV